MARGRVGFREGRVGTVSKYELSSLARHSYASVANMRSLCI